MLRNITEKCIAFNWGRGIFKNTPSPIKLSSSNSRVASTRSKKKNITIRSKKYYLMYYCPFIMYSLFVDYSFGEN